MVVHTYKSEKPDGTWIVKALRLKNVHPASMCAGDHCVIHNPSVHHMLDWTPAFRPDRHGLIERVCEHGVGHPDPDSLAFLSFYGDSGVHGCCGGRCCHVT